MTARIRPSCRVLVTAGQLAGRVGVVQAVMVDGAAVRLPASSDGWPFTTVSIVPLRLLEVLPDDRYAAFVADVGPALF